MPRQSRIDAPGAVHHIVIRGIERKRIFADDRDYRNFLDRFGKVLEETSTPCFAWALMSNHAHLLLRTGVVSITTMMRRLLTGYAQQYNRRHKRHGHLFQNRYKSFLCEEDPYLLELVRYIHLNPLRAGLVKNVKELATYWKAGHATLMGKQKNSWQDTGYILGLFGKHVGAGKRSYSAFVEKGIEMGRRPELVGGGVIRSAGGWSAFQDGRNKSDRMMGDERILGSGDFVESVLKRADEQYDKKTRILSTGWDFDRLVHAVARYFEVEPEMICSSSKKTSISHIRSILCFLAVDKLMMTGAAVASELGLSPSAVSKLVARSRSDELAEKVAASVFDEK